MKVASHTVELCVGRSGQCHSPMWRVECWQEREAVVDEVTPFGNQKLSTIGNDWPNSDQLVVVAIGDLEHGESPDAPSFVALFDGSSKRIAPERGRSEPHDK